MSSESVLQYRRTVRECVPSVVEELSSLLTQSCCCLSAESSLFRTNCHTWQEEDFRLTCDF